MRVELAPRSFSASDVQGSASRGRLAAVAGRAGGGTRSLSRRGAPGLVPEARSVGSEGVPPEVSATRGSHARVSDGIPKAPGRSPHSPHVTS